MGKQWLCGVLTETLSAGPIAVVSLAASFAALGIGFCLIREYLVSFSRRIVHALFHFYALLMLLLLFFKSISDQTPTFLSDLLLLFTPSRRSVLLQALDRLSSAQNITLQHKVQWTALFLLPGFNYLEPLLAYFARALHGITK